MRTAGKGLAAALGLAAVLLTLLAPGSDATTTTPPYFRASEAGATFRCKLDRAKFSACHSPKAYRVRPGKHTFVVAAVGTGGVDPTPARFRFSVRRSRDR